MRALWRSALSSTAALSISIGTSPFCKWNMCPLLALMSLFTFCHIEIFVALCGKKEKKELERPPLAFSIWAATSGLASLLSPMQQHCFAVKVTHFFPGKCIQEVKSIRGWNLSLFCRAQSSVDENTLETPMELSDSFYTAKKLRFWVFLLFFYKRREVNVKNRCFAKALTLLCQKLEFPLEKIVWWDPDLLLLPGRSCLAQGPASLLQHIIIFQL